MIKTLFFTALLITACNFAVAQTNTVDSLQKAYNLNKQHTTLTQLLHQKAVTVFRQVNADSGLRCAHRELAIAQKIRYKKGEVRGRTDIAEYLRIIGDLPGSLRARFEVLPEVTTVEVSTFAPPPLGCGVKVRDNGTGLPGAIKDKIMQPFFTTKPTCEGTGLGLSLSYDIVVKGHGGSITVDTSESEFTEFIVQLPIN